MKSIIKSGKLVNNVVTIITKSNIKKVYTFKTNKLARQYYNDVTNVNQFTIVNTHKCGIVVNVEISIK